MLEKARQAERITAERQAAAERYERFRQAVDVVAEVDTLAASHPSPSPLAVVRATVERLRTLDTRIRELKAALSGEVEVSFNVKPAVTWQPLSRLSVALVLIGLVLAAGTFLLKTINVVDLGDAPKLIGGGVAVLGLAFAGVAWWLRRGDKMSGQLRDVEIDRRLRGRSEMEAELRLTEAGLEQHLGTLGMADLAEAEDLLGREEAHVAQIEKLEAQLDGLVGKEPRETLATMRDAAALEIEQKTSALEALGPIAKEPRARERLEVEVKDSEAAVGQARDDEANARARVEANAVDAEQVAGQAERLAVWREQLSALQRRQRVYAATLEAIDRAEQATMKTATRYLEAHMVRDLATATDGRYRRVRVDDKTLDIEVHAPERGDWVPVSALSQGTLDLVYLIARLGLVRLVTGDRRPPLVFDDPFVTLDDARAARALELLKGIAADFQVIYLTTSDRYDKAADAVVELLGPTAVDNVPDREARLIDPLGAQTATVVLGLVSALTWGSGDFAGGWLSKRTPVLGVVMVSQLVGTVLALGIAILRGETLPPLSDVPWCIGGGVGGGIGIAALYRGLAVGRMGVVAPVTGVLAAVIPAGFGMIVEGVPSAPVVVGIGLAIVAVVLVSRVDDGRSGPSGLGLALLSGVAIGSFGVFISQIGDDRTFGPLTIIRAAEAVLIGAIIVVGRQAWRVDRRLLPAMTAVGILDMSGNAAFILAVQTGALAIAAVLSSLYPVTTVVLATVLLRERVTRSHAVGIALAIVAIVCIAGGSS